MTEKVEPEDEDQISSTLNRDVEILGRGSHTWRNRTLVLEYTEVPGGVRTTFEYYLNGTHIETTKGIWGMNEEGIMQGQFRGHTMEEFVEYHFNNEPVAEIGEIFNDVLERNGIDTE